MLKKLKRLHKWNAWLVILLAVSGVLIFVPAFRTALPQIRLWTKELHIILGVISLIPVLLYVPSALRHIKHIRRNRGQLWNLFIVLFVMAGWIISGFILWQHRLFTPGWNNAALFWHDLLSWVGIPYVIFHSITRLRWVKRAGFKPLIERQSSHVAEPSSIPTRLTQIQPIRRSPGERLREEARVNRPILSRRVFIQMTLGVLLAISIGPYFYRWLKRQFDFGGTAIDALIPPGTEPIPKVPTDASQMIPAPTPLPESEPPIGGGAKGRFRIYTVTEMPTSRAENWTFEITGLVDHPYVYNWDEFMELKREVQVSDFHCVTGWSVHNCTWEGIKLSALLLAAGVQSDAKNVKFYSGDGVYTDTLSLEQANMDDVMVAVMLDGKPLPKTLGGPVRLIVPKMYAYKSVKWLQAIQLIGHDEDGFWIERGYSKDAWV